MNTACRSITLAALFAALACLTLGSADCDPAVQIVTAGDPARPGALAQALQDAYQSGARRIVIRGNRLSSDYSGDVSVNWADGVTVTGNVITGVPLWPANVGALSPISVSHSRAVTLRGNVIQHASVYKPELLSVKENVTNLQGRDASGIQAAR